MDAPVRRNQINQYALVEVAPLGAYISQQSFVTAFQAGHLDLSMRSADPAQLRGILTAWYLRLDGASVTLDADCGTAKPMP